MGAVVTGASVAAGAAGCGAGGASRGGSGEASRTGGGAIAVPTMGVRVAAAQVTTDSAESAVKTTATDLASSGERVVDFGLFILDPALLHSLPDEGHQGIDVRFERGTHDLRTGEHVVG